MNKKVLLKANFFIILMVGLAFVWGCSGTKTTQRPKIEDSENFIIAGSGSNLPITGKLIEGFNKSGEGKKEKSGESKIEMPASIGSSGAIKALNDGAIALGLTSRPLTDKEVATGLKQQPYARIGIVIGVNKSVPDNGITSQDLVNIFLGKKNQWASGDMIIVLSRERGDSTIKDLEKHVPGFKAALEDSFQNKRWQIYYTDQDEAKAITATPFSVGFTDTAALAAQGLEIKPLMLDGVKPDVQNVSNGRYPLYKDLYFVYKEPLPQRAKRFLEFVYSDEGAKIITSNGGIPLKGK